MEQEIMTPEQSPKGAAHAFSPFGCFLAASGVTLLTFCLVGAAAATSAWAVAKLLGLPDTALYVLLGLSGIPVVMASIWTAGRAWHVEQRLAEGYDVDTPVFKVMHYFRKAS